MKWIVAFFSSITFFFFPSLAYAIVPPDFAMTVATQGFQIIGYVLVVASVFFMFIFQYIKKIFSQKKIWILVILILCFLVTLGIAIFASNQVQKNQRIQIEEWSKEIVSPLTISQQQTYQKNKQAIDTFIKKLDPELHIWMRNVTIVALDDLNNYLVQQNRPVIFLSDIELVDNKNLQKILASPSPNRIVLDVRDDYERKFVKLKGVQVIRFGELVNNGFEQIPKDTEIVVLCHTDARSFVAANYLKSQGFTNVKAYKGGAMAWVENNNPIEINRQFQFLWNVLPYLNDEEVATEKKERIAEELVFAPSSSSPEAINSLLMSDSELNTKINTLSPQKRYIIRCTDHHHCFDAVSFLDRARDKNIQFVGYTGYVLP